MQRCFFVIILIGAWAGFVGAKQARACLRPEADRRAIQWSDAIVHAKLATIEDPTNEVYAFTVTDSFDGPLKPDQRIIAHHIHSLRVADCGIHLTSDDVGKKYRLLLRGQPNEQFVIVNIASSDPADTEGAEAFKQLVLETRKTEAGLTDEQMKTQAQAYANAQDDTEADQAEETLEEMGPKAIPSIKQAMTETNDIGKKRLDGILRDLVPPANEAPASQPAR